METGRFCVKPWVCYYRIWDEQHGIFIGNPICSRNSALLICDWLNNSKYLSVNGDFS